MATMVIMKKLVVSGDEEGDILVGDDLRGRPNSTHAIL